MVIALSTGRIASGSNDDRVRVWDYQTGSVVQNYGPISYIRALAQISSNVMAIGGNEVKVWIWCFTNNTLIRTISTPDWIRTIQVVTSNIIAVGNTGAHNTLLLDWTTGTDNRYVTNSGDVIDIAVTTSMLSVSIGENTQTLKVRDISSLNISTGTDVCSKQFTNNLRSMVAQWPIQLCKPLLNFSYISSFKADITLKRSVPTPELVPSPI